MKSINLDHWFVSGNNLSISLLNLHANIKVLKNDKFIYYQLVVTDRNMETLVFNFYTLEDVLSFTIDVVSKCKTRKEVLEKYEMMYEEGMFSLPGGMKKPKNETIYLNRDEVEDALVNHFGKGKNYSVSIDEEMYLDFKGNPKISFYLTEHLDYDGIKKDIRYMLTESDIKNALEDYVNHYGYELNNFKYVGGVHRVGYCFDEDTPYYEGIKLKVSQKNNEKKLIKK